MIGSQKSRKCVGCPYFEIRMEPLKGVDFGLAICKKYDLACDWITKRQLERLECIEEDENG